MGFAGSGTGRPLSNCVVQAFVKVYWTRGHPLLVRASYHLMASGCYPALLLSEDSLLSLLGSQRWEVATERTRTRTTKYMTVGLLRTEPILQNFEDQKFANFFNLKQVNFPVTLGCFSVVRLLCFFFHFWSDCDGIFANTVCSSYNMIVSVPTPRSLCDSTIKALVICIFLHNIGCRHARGKLFPGTMETCV